MAYRIDSLSTLKQHWLMRNSNIPRRFIGLEPSDIAEKTGTFPKQITTWMDSVFAGDIIKNVGGLGKTGVGLLFDGGPGLGKTTHAVTTLMELVRQLPTDMDEARKILSVKQQDYGMAFRPVYYLTFPEFLSRKKALFEADSETKRNLYMEMEGFHGRAPAELDHLNVRVLVLDDLGKEYGSDYNNTSFDEILRSRYDKGLPTIITTNVAREKWAVQYGEAMGSFAFEAFRRIKIVGEDLRKV